MTVKLPSVPPRKVPVLEADGSMSLIWYQWFTILQQNISPGISAGITTAKLTTANGSMTFVNGVLTAETQAT